jgi:peptidoglycan hydrolase CwlO-like protein
MKKFMKYVKIAAGAIVSILGILLAAKAMGNRRKINPKIAKNDAEVKRLESQIQDVKAEKEKLNNELTDLTKAADGRSNFWIYFTSIAHCFRS